MARNNKARAGYAKPQSDDKPEQTEPKSDAKKADQADDDLHATALKQYERGFQKDRKNIDEAYFDLRFAADDQAQWDADALAKRANRPIITVNKVNQFVRQVTGDMRQLRPAIKCVPVDDAASEEVAEKIMPGMIRYIENRSDAQAAYFAAADSQVKAGIGHWRVLTEYADADTFNQEIRIAPIEDGISVVWDPDAILPTREDAMFCFVPVDMSRAAFEERYPGKSPDALTAAPELFRTWVSDDHVRVAEYWYKKPAKRTLALMPDGSVIDFTDADDETKDTALQAGARVEQRDGFQVCRAVISASGIVEDPADWPGRHIPIVPLLGEETKIGREVIRAGVVRYLRGPQKLYNYAVSQQAEIIALQPKAPFIGTKKMFQDFEDEWETANESNWAYLQYTPDEAVPGGKPQREQPPQASQGFQELGAVSSQDMEQVTGIYPANLGAPSNEVSGKAIQARQREGDTGTFNYIEAFGRAVRRTGQIILDLIPHVYDTERMIQIVGEDGKTNSVRINQNVLGQDGISTLTLNDMTVGAYHLIVEMGPSFSTKREEARDGMAALMQSLGPQAAPLIADLYVKQQDFPLSDKIADRLHMLLPPPVLAKEAQENGEEPPPMPPPPPPPPELQMKQMEMQHQAQQSQMDMQLKQQQFGLDQQKLQVEMAKINAELERARLDSETQRMGHQATVQAAQATQDQRVDEVIQAVGQLRDMVMHIAQAVAGPPPGAQPQQPQGIPDQAPPPGGVVASGPQPPAQ